MRYFLSGIEDMLYIITHNPLLFIFFVPSFLAWCVTTFLRFKRFFTHQKTWHY